MEKQNRRQARQRLRHQRRRSLRLRRLTQRIAFTYFFTLMGFILITCLFNFPLYADNAARTPTLWLRLLQFYIYGGPLLIAAGLGVLFRPFWPRFRNFGVLVLTVYVFYSLAIYALRQQYLWSWEQNLAALDPIDVSAEVRQKLHRTGQFDIVERVSFFADVDVAALPPGDYVVYADMSQMGTYLPDSEIGYLEFEKTKQKPANVAVRFDLQPMHYAEFLETGPLKFNLGLQRIVSLDAMGNAIVFFSRWAPLLRLTAWDGWDPVLHKQFLDVEYWSHLASVEIKPPPEDQRWLVFHGYEKSYFKDANTRSGDGELVIELSVESRYAGPVYIQAIIENAPYPVYATQELSEGKQLLSFPIDASHLFQGEGSTGYALTDIKLSTQNPECPFSPETCLKDKPENVLYLENYFAVPQRQPPAEAHSTEAM